jgi:very-short-patch-repair endonuclease
VQIEVYDRWDCLIARLDLGYEEVKLGIEYDGQRHVHLHAKRADDRRSNLLREHDWTLLRYGDADVFGYPAMIVQQVRRVLAPAA